MNSFLLYLYKVVVSLLPETRCFGVKRTLLRFAGAKIGKNVRICSSALIVGAGNLEIGDNTWVGHRCIIVASSFVKIGTNVDIAPSVFVGNGTHGITPDRERVADIELSKDIIIGNGCWICANASILAGVVIGVKCVVAAGAVVTKSFSDLSLIAGVPAILKKEL